MYQGVKDIFKRQK